MDLKDRADASKQTEHSIRRSFKAKNSEGFNASGSAMRNFVFRNICFSLLMMCDMSRMSMTDFFIPEKRLENIYAAKCEGWPSLPQRTVYYREFCKMNDHYDQ